MLHTTLPFWRNVAEVFATALNEVCQGTKWSSSFVTSDSIQAYYIAMLFDGFMMWCLLEGETCLRKTLVVSQSPQT